MILFKLPLGYFLKLCFELVIGMNEVGSKQSQVSRILINFHGKNHFPGVSNALEMTIHIVILFKEFKDLNHP